MADREWFIGVPPDEQGPYTEIQLKGMARQGFIEPETLVRTGDMTTAVPARRVQGLIPPATRRETRTVALPEVAALAKDVGVPEGGPLFRESEPRPATARLPRPTTSRYPAPGTARHVPPAPPPRGTPLGAPRWIDMWPMLVLVMGLGWIVGGYFNQDTGYPREAGPYVLLLALASLPASLLTFLFWLRPKNLPRSTAIGVGLFTAIGGVLTLLMLQWAAAFAGGLKIFSKVLIPLLILILIGLAYQLTESGNIGLRWVGYVFGVGLCEEVVKLIPLAYLVLTKAHRRMGLHTFLALGFVSGLGFGITEALYLYNPWEMVPQTGGNIIRWFACIPSHGAWTAVSAAILWKMGDRLEGADGFWGRTVVVAMAAGSMAIFHGTYDTICSYGTTAALLGDAATFFAMGWFIRYLSGFEEDPPDAHEEPFMHVAAKPAVAGGSLVAAVLFLGLAISGALPMTEVLRSRLPVAYRRYLADVEIRPNVEDLPGPISCSFVIDLDRGALVGSLANASDGDLRVVSITILDADGDIGNIIVRSLIAAGQTCEIDPEKEWSFDPGESLHITWEGNENGIDIRLP